MIRMFAAISGTEAVSKAIDEISSRTADFTTLHSIAGHVWVYQELPLVFREQGPGWRRPMFRAGQRLRDTGRLQASWAYKADAADVKVGTNVRYAATHQFGAVIRPHGRWLLRPLSPPLSISEARAFPSGKAAIQARYPKSFFLARGPEGPGIYRQTSRVAYTVRTRVAHHAIERIAAAMRSVKIDASPMAKKTPRLLDKIARNWVLWIASGAGKQPPAAGTPDAGPRGGQTS